MATIYDSNNAGYIFGTEADEAIVGWGKSGSADSRSGNDKLYGQGGNDILHGGRGTDILIGGTGNDLIFGEKGNDHLNGGEGKDTLVGGVGNDVFMIDETNDVIHGFVSIGTFGGDVMIFDGYPRYEIALADIPYGGSPVMDQFNIGSSPATANTRFFYNQDTGGVFFDPDGTGSAAAIQLASLAPGTAMINEDILVI